MCLMSCLKKAVWQSLQTENYFNDVTLAREDRKIQKHKIIISHRILVHTKNILTQHSNQKFSV